MNQTPYKLLIADDDGVFISKFLEFGTSSIHDVFEIDKAETPEMVRWCIQNKTYDVVLLDINFSENRTDSYEGIDLLREIKKSPRSPYVIMLSTIDDNSVMSLCLTLGADSYFIKSYLSYEKIGAKALKAIQRIQINEKTEEKGKALASKVGASFSSPSMAEAFKRAAQLRHAKSLHCLIIGASGTGKELIARAIGEDCLVEDTRAPFIKVNCANFQDTLVESELFGHEKGSFTGAGSSRKGKFESAHGGTLFLDEVDSLSLKAQASLLRAVQFGEFYPVGSEKPRYATVRVVAATNTKIKEKISKGFFREDLYHRLKGEIIELKPLKERPEDIAPIIEQIIKNSAWPKTYIDPSLLSFLEKCPWSGNVRELETLVVNMMAKAQGDDLELGDLPQQFAAEMKCLDKRHDWACTPKDESEDSASPYRIALDWGLPLDELQQQVAIDYTKKTAKRLDAGKSIQKLAEALDIPKSTLISRMKKWDITTDDFLK